MTITPPSVIISNAASYVSSGCGFAGKKVGNFFVGVWNAPSNLISAYSDWEDRKFYGQEFADFKSTVRTSVPQQKRIKIKYERQIWDTKKEFRNTKREANRQIDTTNRERRKFQNDLFGLERRRLRLSARADCLEAKIKDLKGSSQPPNLREVKVKLKDIRETIQVAEVEIKAAATSHKEWREIRTEIKEQWQTLLLKEKTADQMPSISSDLKRTSMRTAKTNAFNAVERPGDPAEPLEKALKAMEKSFRSIPRQLPAITAPKDWEPDVVIIEP